MRHELAKLILRHSPYVCSREEAMRVARFTGMPQPEIDDYLAEHVPALPGDAWAATEVETNEPAESFARSAA